MNDDNDNDVSNEFVNAGMIEVTGVFTNSPWKLHLMARIKMLSPLLKAVLVLAPLLMSRSNSAVSPLRNASKRGN